MTSESMALARAADPSSPSIGINRVLDFPGIGHFETTAIALDTVLVGSKDKSSISPQRFTFVSAVALESFIVCLSWLFDFVLLSFLTDVHLAVCQASEDLRPKSSSQKDLLRR